MNRFKRAWRSLRGQDRNNNQIEIKGSEELREFIYLDEISVISLLASWRGGLPSIETLTQSKQKGYDFHAKGEGQIPEVGGLSGSANRKTQKAKSRETVLEYDEVQSYFTVLYQDVKDEIKIQPEDNEEISIGEIRRGDLIELQVELTPHTLYQINLASNYLFDVVPESVPPEQKQNLDLISSMIGDRIPVIGRPTNYSIIDDTLVPKEQQETESRNEIKIAGHLESDLLWQDIPNSLLRKRQYSIFCRVEEYHDDGNWHPLSVTRSFYPLSTELANELNSLVQSTSVEMEEIVEQLDMADLEEESPELISNIIPKYKNNIESGHSVELDGWEVVVEQVLEDLDVDADTRSGQVEILNEFTDRIERNHEINVSPEDRVEYRNGLLADPYTQSFQATGVDEINKDPYLEVSIIAIYW